jgi:GGDEF domain-containing protein
VAITRDITERKKLESQLRELSRTDGLTGIPNRRAFDDALSIEWRRAMRESGAQLSLALVDIDHFKKFNDQYGHPRRRRLPPSRCCRNPRDAAASGRSRRTLWRRGIRLSAAQHRCAGCKDHSRTGARGRGRAGPAAGISPRHVITISVGIATMRSSAGWAGTNPMQGFSSWRLIALYEAKRLGRNRVHAAPPLVSIASMWDVIPAQSA